MTDLPEQYELELDKVKHVSLKNKTIKEAFEEFHELNPHIYRNLRYLALQAVRAGRKKLGMRLLWERLRWEYFITTISDDEDDYKLNNDFPPHYSRMLMEKEPELAGVFEIRELKNDDGKKRIVVQVR